MAAPPPVKPRSGSVSGATPLPGMTAAARAEQNPQGNYTFKVLRMNRPSFAMPGLPLHCAASDSASLGTDALVLPKAFGTIFLGEVHAALCLSFPAFDRPLLQVFHGYVAFCNNGSQDFTRCVVSYPLPTVSPSVLILTPVCAAEGGDQLRCKAHAAHG